MAQLLTRADPWVYHVITEMGAQCLRQSPETGISPAKSAVGITEEEVATLINQENARLPESVTEPSSRSDSKEGDETSMQKEERQRRWGGPTPNIHP